MVLYSLILPSLGSEAELVLRWEPTMENFATEGNDQPSLLKTLLGGHK